MPLVKSYKTKNTHLETILSACFWCVAKRLEGFDSVSQNQRLLQADKVIDFSIGDTITRNTNLTTIKLDFLVFLIFILSMFCRTINSFQMHTKSPQLDFKAIASSRGTESNMQGLITILFRRKDIIFYTIKIRSRDFAFCRNDQFFSLRSIFRHCVRKRICFAENKTFSNKEFDDFISCIIQLGNQFW